MYAALSARRQITFVRTCGRDKLSDTGRFVGNWKALTDNVGVCTLLQKAVNHIPLFVVTCSVKGGDDETILNPCSRSTLALSDPLATKGKLTTKLNIHVGAGIGQCANQLPVP